MVECLQSDAVKEDPPERQKKRTPLQNTICLSSELFPRLHPPPSEIILHSMKTFLRYRFGMNDTGLVGGLCVEVGAHLRGRYDHPSCFSVSWRSRCALGDLVGGFHRFLLCPVTGCGSSQLTAGGRVRGMRVLLILAERFSVRASDDLMHYPLN